MVLVMMCPKPELPTHSSMPIPVVQIGSVITLECAPGYHVNATTGSTSVQCMEDLQWNDTFSFCTGDFLYVYLLCGP